MNHERKERDVAWLTSSARCFAAMHEEGHVCKKLLCTYIYYICVCVWLRSEGAWKCEKFSQQSDKNWRNVI